MDRNFSKENERKNSRDEIPRRPPVLARRSAFQTERRRMNTMHLQNILTNMEVENQPDEKSEKPRRPGVPGFANVVAQATEKIGAPGRKSSVLRKASMNLDSLEEIKESCDEKGTPRSVVTMASVASTASAFRRRAGRSTASVAMADGKDEDDSEKTEKEGGLRLTSSAASSKEKKNEEVVGDPNEVILENDDSDDEEEEEVERDFVSALQRIQDSGRLSMQELRIFEKELRADSPFQDEMDFVILAGLEGAKYLEVKADEVLWSRFSDLYSGILSVERPICMIVSGKVSVAKPGIPEGVKVNKGSIVSAADPEVLGVVTHEPCKLLFKDLSVVEADMERSKGAHKRVDHALRRQRPPSTWPEDLVDDLLRSVRFLSFFEDFDVKTLRNLVRNLRFRSVPQGESLPPRPPADVTLVGHQLVLLWLGKAGKYRQVKSPNQEDEFISAHLEMLTELGTRKGVFVPSKEGDMPELDELCEATDSKIYLKRIASVPRGAVLGRRDLVDPGGPDTGEAIIRCEGPCEVLCLSRSDYLHCLKDLGYSASNTSASIII